MILVLSKLSPSRSSSLQISATMAGKIVNYETTPMGSIAMNSCWKSEKDGLQKDSDCQTSDELYSFEESATQTSTYHDQGTQVSKVRPSPILT